MTSTIVIAPVGDIPAIDSAVAANPAFPAAAEGTQFGRDLFLIGDTSETTPSHRMLDHRFTPAQRATIEVMKQYYPSVIVEDYDFEAEPARPGEVVSAAGLKFKSIPNLTTQP